MAVETHEIQGIYTPPDFLREGLRSPRAESPLLVDQDDNVNAYIRLLPFLSRSSVFMSDLNEDGSIILKATTKTGFEDVGRLRLGEDGSLIYRVKDVMTRERTGLDNSFLFSFAPDGSVIYCGYYLSSELDKYPPDFNPYNDLKPLKDPLALQLLLAVQHGLTSNQSDNEKLEKQIDMVSNRSCEIRDAMVLSTVSAALKEFRVRKIGFEGKRKNRKWILMSENAFGIPVSMQYSQKKHGPLTFSFWNGFLTIGVGAVDENFEEEYSVTVKTVSGEANFAPNEETTKLIQRLVKSFDIGLLSKIPNLERIASYYRQFGIISDAYKDAVEARNAHAALHSTLNGTSRRNYYDTHYQPIVELWEEVPAEAA